MTAAGSSRWLPFFSSFNKKAKELSRSGSWVVTSLTSGGRHSSHAWGFCPYCVHPVRQGKSSESLTSVFQKSSDLLKLILFHLPRILSKQFKWTQQQLQCQIMWISYFFPFLHSYLKMLLFRSRQRKVLYPLRRYMTIFFLQKWQAFSKVKCNEKVIDKSASSHGKLFVLRQP